MWRGRPTEAAEAGGRAGHANRERGERHDDRGRGPHALRAEADQLPRPVHATMCSGEEGARGGVQGAHGQQGIPSQAARGGQDRRHAMRGASHAERALCVQFRDRALRGRRRAILSQYVRGGPAVGVRPFRRAQHTLPRAHQQNRAVHLVLAPSGTWLEECQGGGPEGEGRSDAPREHGGPQVNGTSHALGARDHRTVLFALLTNPTSSPRAAPCAAPPTTQPSCSPACAARWGRSASCCTRC